MVVCAGIGSADDHNCHVIVGACGVDAVVVYGGAEEVRVLREPAMVC